MKIALIVAHDSNLLIGKDGGLPWRFPEDLKHFKAQTLGHVVIMGRRVFEEIGCRPLPKRTNIVLSRTKDFAPVATFGSLEEALAHCRELGEDKVFIIGGAKLYAETLPIADELIVTEVARTFDGDTWFPEYRDQIGTTWRETSRREGGELTFVHYERVGESQASA
ncbi:MAG: dihydrofolate reductase [Planctomycetota bacterium]